MRQLRLEPHTDRAHRVDNLCSVAVPRDAISEEANDVRSVCSDESLVLRHVWNRTALRLCTTTTLPNATRIGLAAPFRWGLAVRTRRLRTANTASDLVWLSGRTAWGIEQSDFATGRAADSAARTE